MTRIVLISDTHTFLPDTTYWPDADAVIHAGDFMGNGYRQNEVKDFGKWFSNLNYPSRILVGGNHDRMLETHKDYCLSKFSSEVIYLENDSVEIDGLNFFGSPITPWFYNWSWNVFPKDIKPYWDAIPDDTNILITHGPPKGILDSLTVSRPGMSPPGEPLGCPELRNRVEELKDLKLHVFGHIHGGKGTLVKDGTWFVNASYVDEDYQPILATPFTYLEIE